MGGPANSSVGTGLVPHPGPAANHNQADFAVVLLDVNMSSMDGIATARLIRQREGLRSTRRFNLCEEYLQRARDESPNLHGV